MNLKRFSLAITVVFVMLATIFGAATQAAFAATVCTPTSTVSGPFAQDGVGDLCFQTTNLCTYINSWNVTTLEVNGTAHNNVYVFSNTIAPVNGVYIIHYVSTVAWGHFEFGGTCSTGGATPTNTPVVPTGTRTNTPTGPSVTPTRTSTVTNTPTGPSATPSRTATRTNTPTGPSATPTRTNTPVGPSATPTRTNTPVGPSATPTRTNTPVGPSATPTRTATPCTSGCGHLANPFSGAKWYVNPDWAAEVNASSVSASQKSLVSQQNTAVWLDSMGSLNGTGGGRGLLGHLDAAVSQGASLITIVVYDLPGRDCSALASNGELPATAAGLATYETSYIDVIASDIASKPAYANLRIVAIVEPDSLPNMITNTGVAKCSTVNSLGLYTSGITYAINKLHAFSNVYLYLDFGHAGWLGWSNNFTPAITLYTNLVKGTSAGVNSIDGFIDNTANNQVQTEPYITASQSIGGQPVISATFFSYNPYIEEDTFDTAWKAAMQSAGLPASSTNMLIDTSRNGWGGCGGGANVSQQCRPTGPSTSTDVNTFVNASRIDRRPAKGDWCNQNGAGLGERPTGSPSNSVYEAYVWIKPPGESDGSSSLIPVGPDNPDGKGFDSMCDPAYGGNSLNQNMNSNALPNAPVSGRWFEAQFDQLVANAFPAIP